MIEAAGMLAWLSVALLLVALAVWLKRLRTPIVAPAGQQRNLKVGLAEGAAQLLVSAFGLSIVAAALALGALIWV